MSFKFDHINQAHYFIVEKLSDDALLGRNGYTMRKAHYVLDYPPKQEADAKQLIKVICEQDLRVHSVKPLLIDLYDIVLDYLDEQGMWDMLVDAEAQASREELTMMLQDTVSVRNVITPEVNKMIEDAPDADIVFITGVGETYPYVRTHTLLTEMTTDKPVVLVFPGYFERRGDGSTSLNILDVEQGSTGGYYRATRIFDL